MIGRVKKLVEGWLPRPGEEEESPPPENAAKKTKFNTIENRDDARNATKEDVERLTKQDFADQTDNDVMHEGNGGVYDAGNDPDRESTTFPPAEYSEEEPTTEPKIRAGFTKVEGQHPGSGGHDIYTREDKPQDMAFVRAMLDQDSAVFAWAHLLLPGAVVHALLISLFYTGLLCVLYYSRGGGASGDWVRTREILLQVAVFRRLIYGLESICYIYRGYFFANLSGKHPYHNDNFAEGATHR